MAPTALVTLPALPTTPSGKVDRKALPAPSRERPPLSVSWVTPRTATEQRIAAIWCDVLQLDRVGINDPFFDLGGHSLALARVHEKLNCTLPLAALFQFPTVASLAAAIDGKSNSQTYELEKKHSVDEPIAIIGYSGRFPGAESADAFWTNLCAGVESISHF